MRKEDGLSERCLEPLPVMQLSNVPLVWFLSLGEAHVGRLQETPVPHLHSKNKASCLFITFNKKNPDPLNLVVQKVGKIC